MSSSSQEDAILRSKVREQEVVARLGQRALDADGLGPVLEETTTAIVEPLDVEFAGVFELESSRQAAVLASGHGWPDGVDETPEDPTETPALPTDPEALAGHVLETDGPVIVADLHAAEEFDACDWIEDAGVASALLAPIGPDGDPWGVLGAFATEPTQFDPHQVDFVRRVANLLGSAVENERLREQSPDPERVEELERFETLFTESRDVNAVLNPDGTFQYVPPSVENVLGYDPAELVGSNAFERVHPEDHEHVLAEFQALVEDPDHEPVIEFRYEHADGSWVVLEARGRNLLDDSDIGGMVAYTREVTERVEYERELEARSAAMEQSIDGMAILNEDEEYVFANQAHADVYGFDDPDELLGETWRLCYHDDEIERLEAEAMSELAAEGSWRGEAVGRCADGTSFPQELSLTILDDGRFVCVVRDVSEQAERGRELAKYETIVEAIDDGIYVKDADERFTMVNDAYAELTGYDREELLGQHASLVVDEDVVDRAREAEPEADEATTRSGTIEAAIQRSDGASVPAEATFATLHGDDGIEQIGVVRDVTDRKERQQELRERERQLSTLIDNVPGMVYRCRNERGWPMEFVSDACEELTGYEPEVLERNERSWGEDVVVEEDREAVWETVQEEVGDDGTFSATYRIETADGEQRWVRDYGRGVFEDGEFVAIEGIISDVTERKRLEAELDEVFGRVTEAIYALDEEWRFTHVNDRATELLQHSEEELLGEEFWEVIPEAADRIEVWEAFHEAMETQESRSFELYFDTLEFWVEATVFPSETGVSVYFRDVTERRDYEQELQRKERRYEAVFEDPNILVGLLEPDGTVLDVNETAMEYVDADLGDVTGELFWETPWWGSGDGGEHSDGVQDDVREWTERAAAGEYVEFEADLTRPDGDRYTLEGYFRPVTDDDGEVVSIIVSDSDVTERKERERQLEESERRYRTLVEHFPNGAVGLVDEDLRYQIVGGSPMDVTGATVEDIEGQPVADAIADPLAEELVPGYEAALAEGEERTFEVEHGGKIFQFQIVPVRDDDGEVFAALGMSQDVTDHRENERRLEESERRYRTLAQHFPNGIVTLFDTDLEYTLAAGQGFEDVPPDPEEVEGEYVGDAWDEETVARLQPAFEAALDGEEQSVELAYHDRDWIVRVVPLTDEHGDVFAGMTVAQDISERKAYERYLEDAKSQLEAATEAGAVGTWEWDVGDDEMVVDESFARTFGIDPGPASQGVALDRFLSAIHDGDRERVEAEIEAVLDRCGEYEAEYRVRDADDEVRWVVARGRVECDEDGEPVSFPGALTDITERKRAELELQRNKEQLESLFEILPVGVVVAEGDGQMVQANDVAREIWGGDVFDAGSIEEYDQYPVRWADTGERVEPEQMTLPRALRGEEVLEPDVFEIDAADGERRIIEAAGMPIRNDDGEVTRGVVTLADVTQQREYQRRIEESERRYRTMIDSFPNGVVGLFDENLEYVAVGGAALSDVGVDPEEIVGKHVRDRYSEEIADRLEPKFRAALDGESNAFEWEFHGRHWLSHTVPVGEGDDVRAGMVMVQDITDRKQVEQELRESEAKFRMLAENLEQIVWMSDARTQETYYVNPAFEDVWGASRDVLYDDSHSILQAVHPEDRERVEAVFDDPNQVEYDMDYRIVQPNGEVRWLHARTVAIRDGDGEPDRIVGIADDVTERKERERELEESERRYRTLVEHFPQGSVGLFDEDLEYTAIGGQLLEDVGVAPEDRLGSDVSDIYPDELAEEVQPHFEAALDGDTTSFEAEFHDRHLFAYTLPVRDADDEVFAGMLVVQDVTERRESERRLERYREYTDDVLDAIPDVFYIVDEDGRLQRWNQSLAEITGYDDETIASMDLQSFYVGEDRTDAAAAIAEGFETGSTQAELEMQTESGDRVPFEFVGTTLEDPDGNEVLAGIGRDVTERRQRRRELEESERRYRTFAEHFPNGAVGVFDANLEYTLAAGAKLGEELPGADVLEGDRMPDIFPEDTVADLEPLFRAAVEDGETGSTETQFADRHWRVWATPLRDADGEIFAGLSFAQDVTEQRERERELERALDLLNKTERIADVAGWEVDPETMEPYWSEHLFDLVEGSYDGQPSIDDALSVYQTDEDRAIVEDAIEEALETGGSFDVMARFPRPEGDVGQLRIQGEPEVEGDEVVSLRGAVQDVTEQVEREQALEESKNQLRTLIELLPVSVFVAEPDGRIVEWNEAAAEIWGGEVAEADSVAAYDQYDGWRVDTEEPIAPDEWALARALDGEEVSDPDVVEIEGFDGERRTVLNHAMPVRDADGEVTRAVATLIDITEREEYERKLEASNERLEQFAYAASHDLQEPLRMVSSYLTLLERRYGDALDEDGREFVDYAVDGADRMRDMIDGLLEYSRVETRGDPFESVDLDDVLEDARQDLQMRIEESDAEITAVALPSVVGDPGQLGQVFQNLLKNGIEYSSDEPPRIHVDAERRGDEWVIAVQDDGIGIDPDQADRIFQVFQRLHSHEEHPGTGIGLALCRRIVERHGGEIWVDSEPEGGSTFSFTLPVKGERDG